MKMFKCFFDSDEREKLEKNKFCSEAYLLIMMFLFVVIVIKQIFLRMPVSKYAIELSAFAIGAIYTFIRSILAGKIANQKQNKILLFLLPFIASSIYTVFIYIKSYKLMKIHSFSENAIVLAKSFLLLFVVTFIMSLAFITLAKKRSKSIAEKLEEE